MRSQANHLETKRLSYLCRMTPTSVMAHMIFAPLYSLLLINAQADITTTIIWNSVLYAVLITRYRLAKSFSNIRKKSTIIAKDIIEKQTRNQVVINAMISLTWAYGFTLLFYTPPSDLSIGYHMTIISLTIGFIGVAITSAGTVQSVYLAFVLPISATVVILFLLNDSWFYQLAAFFSLFGFLFLIATRKKFSKQFDKTIIQNQTIIKNELDLVSRLATASEFRDEETGNHVNRMSQNCFLLAIEAGLPRDTLKRIKVASSLHDIGKIGIPDSILLKPGSFTTEERAAMNQHPLIGAKILGNSQSRMVKMAESIALNHHEKFDGTGYPHGLTGEEIPIEARIASICDVYDALTSTRPYKKPWPHEKALAYIIENSGSHFDPKLVASFMKIYPEILEYAKKNA